MDKAKQERTSRLRLVSQLKANGHSPSSIAKLMGVSSRTIQRDLSDLKSDSNGLHTHKPVSELAIVPKIEPVSEIIGTARQPSLTFWPAQNYPQTVDSYRADYAFWDKLRAGKAEGYELSGTFCRPICDIVSSYVFGNPPTYTLDPDEDELGITDRKRYYTDQCLADWLEAYHATVLTMISDEYALGDQFVIINPDASITIPSPDTVKVEWDILDPKVMLAVTVTQKYAGTVITDRYTAMGRTRNVQIGATNYSENYANLTGILPVVRFPNDMRTNEQFGRPIYEALLPLLAAYDDLLDKALDGVRVMGNPIPVFEGMENIGETITRNQTDADDTPYVDENGMSETRESISFDTNSAIFVGKGGEFNFKSPQVGFTEDMRRVLKSLFLLICDHTRIPEYMWGAAVEASKASTETQTPPFIAYINWKRIQLDGSPNVNAQIGMKALLNLILRTKRLTDPKIIVTKLQSRWPNLALEDEQIKMQKTVYARGVGLIDSATTLDLLSIVPDAVKAVEDAQKEAETLQQNLMDDESQLNRVAYERVRPEGPQSPGGGKDNNPKEEK